MTNTSTVSGRTKVFVDTGGWYALSATEDRYHAASVRYYQELRDRGAHFLTSDYVLDETLTRLRYDIGHQAALTFWQSIRQVQATEILSLLKVDESVWASAIDIFKKYDDQDFSFTDCTSFVLAREQGVDEVFAFDRHFLMFSFAVRPTV